MENKNKLSLIFLLTFLILNIGLVSAWDLDNTQSYDPITRTYTIENWFGLGGILAEIKLISELNVRVPMGYQKVGEFELYNFKKDYNNAFKDMNFYQANDLSKEISRTFDYKYLDYQIEEQAIYETICLTKNSPNRTQYEDCKREEIDKENVLVPVWIKFNDVNELPSNQESFTIGIFTEVLKDDYVEWIPTFFGERLTEWSTWTESLSVDILAYYKLDRTTGAVIDSTDQNNGTNVGADRGIAGKINKSFDFIRTDGSYGDHFTITQEDLTDFTLNMWLKPSGVFGSNENTIVSRKDGTGATSDRIWFAPDIFFQTDGGGTDTDFTPPNHAGVYKMYTFIRDGTDFQIFLNGESVHNDTVSNNVFSISSFFGKLDTGTSVEAYDGEADEIGLWSRALGALEVEQLYNGNTGITLPLTPIINILFPENITYNNTLTELNYTVTDGDRCWFSTDGGASNSSDVVAGINFTGLTSISLQNEWTVYCNNTKGVGLSIVSFFVNKSAQTELISPVNDSNFTATQINFSVNSSVINTNLTNVTLFVWFTNGTLFLTNETILSGSNETQTKFTSNLTEGTFLWNAETCGVDISCAFADNNRTLEVHTTPTTIIIHYPNETIDFLAVGGNLTLNWTILEPGQNLTEHIINCSYIYNGVTTGLNQSQCISINETSFLYVAGINNLTFSVLEEFGLISTNITSWDFLFEKYNVTFNNNTFEGFQENFRAEIILMSGESISEAIFYYNNTNYTTSIIFSGGEYIVSSSITIPSVENNVNVSLGFFITVGGTIYNLTSFQQQIFNINFTNCAVSNDTVLNMSLFNEETKTSILGDIEINAQAISKTSGKIVASTNLSFTNVSFGAICLTPIGAYSNLYFSSEIRYVSDNFVPEFYNIQLADMEDFPRNLSLFDLATNDSTEFSITYQDDSLIPVENAIIQLQRKYISENIYEIVEAPLTSNTGTATVHIDLNTNKYRASVVKNGVLLGFFDNLVFDCENELSGACTELLLGTIDPQNNVPLISLTDFTYFISSDNNTITTTFIVPSGTPSNINIVLTQVDIFGNETTCNQSIVSSAGSIDCDFDTTIGDSFLTLKISKDSELKAQQTFIVVDDTTLNFLGNNFFIVIIILLSLVGMAIASPEWMIINAVIVMLIGGALWLLNGMNFVMGLGSLIWLIISALILIIKIAKQEDR